MIEVLVHKLDTRFVLLDRSVSYRHDFIFVTVPQFEKCLANSLGGGRQYEVKVLIVRK